MKYIHYFLDPDTLCIHLNSSYLYITIFGQFYIDIIETNYYNSRVVDMQHNGHLQEDSPQDSKKGNSIQIQNYNSRMLNRTLYFINTYYIDMYKYMHINLYIFCRYWSISQNNICINIIYIE